MRAGSYLSPLVEGSGLASPELYGSLHRELCEREAICRPLWKDLAWPVLSYAARFIASYASGKLYKLKSPPGIAPRGPF